MKRVKKGAILTIACCYLVFGQSANRRPNFVAADVHAVQGAGMDFRAIPIHDGRYELKNASMLDMLRTAYGFEADRIVGGPSWLELDRFDITAKLPGESTPDNQKLMLQTLLEDRFKLVVHKDTRPITGYVLTAGGKPALRRAGSTEKSGCMQQAPALGNGLPVTYRCRNMTMTAFAQGLNSLFGTNLGTSPVLDETRLTGAWDFDVSWTVAVNGVVGDGSAGRVTVTVSDAIAKLGLKLEKRGIPMPALVVERVNRTPTANAPDIARLMPPILPPTHFDVASVRPSNPASRGGGLSIRRDRLTMRGAPMKTLLEWAFQDPVSRIPPWIAGSPDWVEFDRFDVLAKAPPNTAPLDRTRSVLPVGTALLVAVWVAGCAVIFTKWWARWLRIRAALRAASTLPIQAPLKVMSSSTLFEPGVFGIIRPVLLLPEGIAKRLAPAQFRAVLAHELCHVRRHDNLASAVHMVVETAFWFHPLVWWIGARMIEERERACDEEVLRLGNEAQAYAEGILNVCKFYLESPLACVSGVTGADLKKRIESIVNAGVPHDLNFWRRILLGVAAFAVVAGPIAIGISNAPPGLAQSAAGAQTKITAATSPRFEVVSVKSSTGTGGQLAEERNRGWGDVTGRVNLRSIPLRYVLQKVYDLQAYQLSGPAWLDTEPFDILATAPAGAPKDQIPLMFQDLLAERFKMKFHRETQTAASYAMVVGEGGPKLKEALVDDGSEVPSTVKITGRDEKTSISGMGNGKFGRFKLTAANGVLHYEFASMTAKALAEFLSQGSVDLPVVDMTELRGSYQVPLDIPARRFPAAQSDAGQPVPAASEPSGTSVRGSLEKLGLRLVRRRFPIEKFVIDHIERRPTPN